MNETQGFASSLNQAQLNNQRPSDIFEELRAAQAQFAEMCHKFQEIAQARSNAEKILQEITQKAAHVMQNALQDPTVPQAIPQQAIPIPGIQPGMMPPPGNNRW